MRKFSSLVIAAIIGSSIYCPAQSNFTGPSYEPSMPPSPEVANMLQYVNQPVNMATGTPEISIPIYEINTGLLTLPITLSYHANGIRVNQEAGNVGLGWTLNAEGVISKQVMGKPDNSSYSSSGGPSWTPRMLLTNDQTDLTLLRSLGQYNTIDGIPDLYTFRFNNHSGKFIIPQGSAPVLLPQQDLDFSYQAIGTWPDGIWKITDEGGTQYLFSALEKTFSRSNTNLSADNISWYLTKIRSYNDNDSIVLSYADTYVELNPGTQFTSLLWFNETQSPAPNTPPAGAPTLQQTIRTEVLTQTQGKRLSQIVFTGGTVDYTVQGSRADYSVTTYPMVKSILVRNTNGTIVKAAHFGYDYFTSTVNSPVGKRLKLITLTLNASTSVGTPSDQVYTFQYNPGLLPPKNSFAMDHWGYYNGATSNNTMYQTGTLIPTWQRCTPSLSAPTCRDCSDPANQTTRFSGANRNPHPTYMQYGMLTGIVYPTGGSRIFDYEPHSIAPVTATYDRLIDSITTVSVVNTTGGQKSSTAYIVYIPNTALYSNGVCAVLSASANYPTTDLSWGTRGDLWAAHAQCRVMVHEVGKSAPINSQAEIAFGYAGASSPAGESRTFVLQPGKSYQISAYANWQGFSTYGEIQLKYPLTLPNTDRTIGGVRIKRTSNFSQYTPAKSEDVVYDYNSPTTGFSSGQIAFEPTYYDALYSRLYKYRQCPVPPQVNPNLPCCNWETQGIQLTSNSLDNLSSSNHIFYANVRELKGANGEGGYTQNKYTVFSDFNPIIGQQDCEWRRGLLKSSETFDAGGNIKSTRINNYVIDEPNVQQYVGRSVGFLGEHPCAGPASDMDVYPSWFSQKLYVFRSEWLRLAADTEYNFLNGGMIETHKRYEYAGSSHQQITMIEDVRSNTLKLFSHFKFPTDFGSIPPSSNNTSSVEAIRLLQAKHVHNIPIESYKAKTSGTGIIYTAGELLTFNPNVRDQVFPAEKYLLMINSPLTSFSPSAIASFNLTKDSHYSSEVTIQKVDPRGNILHVATKRAKADYIYDYDSLYVVAKGISTDSNISFASFETDVHGGFYYQQSAVTGAEKRTGHKSFNLNVDAIEFPMPDTNYVLSYWIKGGTVTSLPSPVISGPTINGWTYCEHLLSRYYGHPIAYTIAGTGYIDELRRFPKTGQLETFNYDPLIGVTSKSDVSGKLTFFEYDDIGRLILTRGQDGNILNKFQYGIQAAE